MTQSMEKNQGVMTSQCTVEVKIVCMCSHEIIDCEKKGKNSVRLKCVRSAWSFSKKTRHSYICCKSEIRQTLVWRISNL